MKILITLTKNKMCFMMTGTYVSQDSFGDKYGVSIIGMEFIGDYELFCETFKVMDCRTSSSNHMIILDDQPLKMNVQVSA